MAEAAEDDDKRWYEREQDEETKKKLADTNMENYGGKEHRDKQREIAKKQKEWQGCGEKEGVEVWRIKQFKVVKEEGFDEKFYNGDSYIVLDSYKTEGKDDLKYNVHFWLGKDTTQDEAGSAAIKTVELDDYFGDLPVQFRQVQGHETKEFLDLWDHMQILEGGEESGFRKVGPKEYKTRLIHVESRKKKNKRVVHCDEVPVSIESLNNCDAFILDAGLKIYDFRPANCNVWEKRAANDYVNQLKSERAKVEANIVVWGESGKAVDEFWQILNDGNVPDDLPDEAAWKQKQKDEMEVAAKVKPALYHVTDEDGGMKVTCVKEIEDQKHKFDKSILKEEDDDVLIVDVGTEIFVWIGSTANKDEMKTAMKHAQDYLKESGRPFYLPITRLQSGKETKAFLKWFK